MQYATLTQKHANLRPKKQGYFSPLCSGTSTQGRASPERRRRILAAVTSTHINSPPCRCTSPSCQQTVFKQKCLLEVLHTWFCISQRPQDFLSWHKWKNSPFKSGSSQGPSARIKKCSLKRLGEFKTVINNKRGRVVRTANYLLYICI